MNNSKLIKEWFKGISQQLPSKPDLELGYNELCLLQKFMDEEYMEFNDEVNKYLECRFMSSKVPQEVVVDLAKEAGDALFTIYGLLTALGLDGEKILSIVANNNLKKIPNMKKRDDGKVIVDKEVKEKLKKEVLSELNKLLF